MQRSFPPLTVSQRQLLQEGILLFNREQFFECHEVLEAAWLDASGEQKAFLQGLIQVAVAFLHLRRGNFIGAGRLLAAGMDKLSAFAPQQEPAKEAAPESVDVAGLLESLGPLRKTIGAGEISRDWQAPKILWKPPPPFPSLSR